MLDLVMQSVASGIAVGCVYGLIGIGFCVIYNASGIVNFAQGAFVMLGGMVASAAFRRYGLPLPVAALCAIVMCAGLGAILERVVVRPLWKRQSTTFVIILATLAAQIVLEQLTLLVAGDQPGALPMFTDRPPLSIGHLAISYQFLWILAGTAAAIAFLTLFFSSTKTGKAMRACSIDRDAAALQGIPVSRMQALAFIISASLGAFAGVLITPTQYAAYNLGIPFAITGFIAAIVGGFGRPLGALAGGLFLGIAQALAIVFVGSAFKNITALGLLLVFLFVRPTGLLGPAR